MTSSPLPLPLQKQRLQQLQLLLFFINQVQRALQEADPTMGAESLQYIGDSGKLDDRAELMGLPRGEKGCVSPCCLFSFGFAQASYGIVLRWKQIQVLVPIILYPSLYPTCIAVIIFIFHFL